MRMPKSEMSYREVGKILGIYGLLSQIYVAPAFILIYLIMLQCKSLDGTANLAIVMPWYAYVFAYLIVTFFAVIFQISKDMDGDC